MAGLDLIFADEPCAEALDDERLLAAMARFEAALALASARCGLVPQADAQTIAQVCQSARFDAQALARAARKDGALAIPFVRELRDRVAAVSIEAARHVHAGATSQDVMDTAMVLCLRVASSRLTALAVQLGNAAADLAQRHRGTAMAARTLLQPALPIPFGFKAANWLAQLARSLPQFRAAVEGACVLQFGGPAGTLSSYGKASLALETALADELGLPLPTLSWHSARDSLARLGAEAAILTGIAAKAARDVALLMQAEVGEAAEGSPGGSSSMPHKRNPAGSLLALEAAQRAPGLAATLLGELAPEHERGLGQWQSQWFTLRELFCAAASALAAMASVLEDLEVHAEAMRENLERSGIPAAELQRDLATAGPLIERALEQWAAISRGISP